MPETNTLILTHSEHRLKAKGGEIVLLRGDSGSGKSLWLKRMAGLKEAADTTIQMNNKTAKVRLLFDRWPYLWLGGTLEEELLFGLGQQATPQQLENTLSRWHLSDLSLASDVQSLNRLQSLHLSLAAITLAKPGLVLLDNPSAALSEEQALRFSEDIEACFKDSNTIVVVASNRWQDWRTVATQTWSVRTPDQLPEKLETHNT